MSNSGVPGIARTGSHQAIGRAVRTLVVTLSVPKSARIDRPVPAGIDVGFGDAVIDARQRRHSSHAWSTSPFRAWQGHRTLQNRLPGRLAAI
jgi:hypothetical protein